MSESHNRLRTSRPAAKGEHVQPEIPLPRDERFVPHIAHYGRPTLQCLERSRLARRDCRSMHITSALENRGESPLTVPLAVADLAEGTLVGR